MPTQDCPFFHTTEGPAVPLSSRYPSVNMAIPSRIFSATADVNWTV